MNRHVIVSEEMEENIPDSEDFTKEILDKYSAEKILNIINDFDDESKDILFLRIYEDYTFAEISSHIGMNESAVKMRYYRLLKNVTKKLKEV